MNPQALKLTAEFQEATRPRTLDEIKEAILTLHNTIDENGEITPEAAAEFDALDISKERKVEGYDIAISHELADAKVCDEMAKKYEARAEVHRKSAERMKDRLKRFMEDLGEARIRTPTVTVGICKNSSPTLIRPKTLPARYMKQVLEEDLKLLREDLKAGVQVEGCKLEHGTHIKFW